MSVRHFIPGSPPAELESLEQIVQSLQARRRPLAWIRAGTMLDLFDDFGRGILESPAARGIEGLAFLSSWLRRPNLERLLSLNLHGQAQCLDRFVPLGDGTMLAAKPRGLAAMWMPGNVPTLPIFSLVQALLAKNVCLVKLGDADPAVTEALLTVLRQSRAESLTGEELLQAVAVVWFDYRDTGPNREMSLAADAKIIWGGQAAVQALSALPKREHCVEIVFGPKYSIAVLDRKRLEKPEGLENVLAALVRDVAVFDQRACTSPQTIFFERNAALSGRQLGELLARHLARLPAKPLADAYTTARILDARAAWALREDADVISSGQDADWTVCIDRDLTLKDAVQSRTVFLTEVEGWRQIIPLLSPKIQTVGIAFAQGDDAKAFAQEATLAGAVRCVRPGLMNVYESPWDGRLVISDLVRWVTLKP